MKFIVVHKRLGDALQLATSDGYPHIVRDHAKATRFATHAEAEAARREVDGFYDCYRVEEVQE